MTHLLDISDLGLRGIQETMTLGDQFEEVRGRAVPKVPALRAKTVAHMFFEDSTRTRVSFESAAKRLSADVMAFNPGSSSLKKGESLRDTVETLLAMGPDLLIVRHGSAGAPVQIARWTDAFTGGTVPVVNAGDGWHQHPTQALADMFTVRAALGDRNGLRPDDFEGLKIALVGDIKHSRVARSNVQAFSLMGAEVSLVAPNTLLPPSLVGWTASVNADLDDALSSADVVYLLRLQSERMEDSLVPSLREYHQRFGLTDERLGRLDDKTIIMHPGPMNRGVEVTGEAMSHPGARITDQVRNGVSVRMAVLFRLLGVKATPPTRGSAADV